MIQTFGEKVKPETWKNRAVTDIMEPGSVFKIIPIAAAIEEELLTPQTRMEIPETLQLANRVIKEAHKRDPELKTPFQLKRFLYTP